MIYYRNHLVGGTSPLTGVFAGISYDNLGSDASDINWYRDGKFEDPTNYLDPEQVQKVYLLLRILMGILLILRRKLILNAVTNLT